MDYLVPGWHQLINDWAYTVPMVEFDDAVSHLQILRDDQQPAGLIVTDYQPQLSSKLDQFSLAPAKIYAAFDYLQGVEHFDSRVVDYRCLPWPNDAVFDLTPFRLQVVSQGRKYAQVSFDNQGKMLWIDYFQPDGQLDRRLLLDSRGFASREEEYADGQPRVFSYLDEQGRWRLRQDQQTGRVTINPDLPRFTKKLAYDQLGELVTEIVQDYLLPQLKAADRLIVSLDDHQLVAPDVFSQQERVVFSASRWHPYRQALAQIAQADRGLIADSRATAQEVQQICQLAEPPAIIPIFQAQFKLGHSQRSRRQRIAVFCEYTGHDELARIVEMVYQLLLKNPQELAADYLTYSPEKEREVRQLIADLADRHAGEFEFQPDQPDRNENEQDLQEEVLPRLEIKAARLTSTSAVLKALDQARIMVDWGTKIDQFMQIAVISVGIPQIRQAPTEMLQSGQNGIVEADLDNLPADLNYYLQSQRHWNAALANNVQFLNQYSEENLLKKWQEIL